ncbi:hypothetical protein BD289DRAFT_432903 [Coniella lustricola]|uniref:Lipid droplet-associated hydrolase n=1 Tax=Coniella lustricola TaxID=2025994 RepID=A0A2T3A983_9PEZI|nr:hypothetical protein BD289DRAFT_432903 [Coniella lustricola]
MPVELSYPSPHLGSSASSSTRHCLVYFLPGNPGLIDYYGPFLAHLRQLLDHIEVRRKHAVTFHIYGRNLAGFDDADHPAPFNTTTNRPFDVEAQIQYSMKHLVAIASKVPRLSTDDTDVAAAAEQSLIPTATPTAQDKPFNEVILIGHSLGTYLALEIFHRHLHDPAGITSTIALKSGILLFATIAHLAKSRKGVQLNLIRRTPFLSTHVHTLAKLLLLLLPRFVAYWFLARIWGMAPHAAATTTRFLKDSRDGVHQALYLGMDELKVISEETWAEELWEIGDEAAAHAHEIPKFFIFFGKDDHWVPNEVRDRFIEKREEHAAREDAPRTKRGRTRIEVDEQGLPHDFCISEFDLFCILREPTCLVVVPSREVEYI